MIILDTNVISELMRAEPDRQVVAWLDGRPASSIWTTAVTVFEIEFGIWRLPEGKRRTSLRDAFSGFLLEDLEGRVLDFDAVAAVEVGQLAAELEARGLALEIRDLQIAAIVKLRQGRLATRNLTHFAQACDAVDPWTAP